MSRVVEEQQEETEGKQHTTSQSPNHTHPASAEAGGEKGPLRSGARREASGLGGGGGNGGRGGRGTLSTLFLRGFVTPAATASSSSSMVRAAGRDVTRRGKARTQRRPKEEGRGVDCRAELKAKPDRGDGGGAGGGGSVVVVVVVKPLLPVFLPFSTHSTQQHVLYVQQYIVPISVLVFNPGLFTGRIKPRPRWSGRMG